MTLTWSKVGDMVKGREGHNVIHDGNVFLVVGGNGFDMKTEKCSLVDDKIKCLAQFPELDNYNNYPELFLVAADFCRDIP